MYHLGKGLETNRIILLIYLFITSVTINAQDSRSQFPTVLQKSFFGVDFGYMRYPFSNRNLAPGYSAEMIAIPAEAVRLTLFGYHFTKNLSARITYMRPVDWVSYYIVIG